MKQARLEPRRPTTPPSLPLMAVTKTADLHPVTGRKSKFAI